MDRIIALPFFQPRIQNERRPTDAMVANSLRGSSVSIFLCRYQKRKRYYLSYILTAAFYIVHSSASSTLISPTQYTIFCHDLADTDLLEPKSPWSADTTLHFELNPLLNRINSYDGLKMISERPSCLFSRVTARYASGFAWQLRHRFIFSPLVL